MRRRSGAAAVDWVAVMRLPTVDVAGEGPRVHVTNGGGAVARGGRTRITARFWSAAAGEAEAVAQAARAASCASGPRRRSLRCPTSATSASTSASRSSSTGSAHMTSGAGVQLRASDASSAGTTTRDLLALLQNGAGDLRRDLVREHGLEDPVGVVGRAPAE